MLQMDQATLEQVFAQESQQLEHGNSAGTSAAASGPSPTPAAAAPARARERADSAKLTTAPSKHREGSHHPSAPRPGRAPQAIRCAAYANSTMFVHRLRQDVQDLLDEFARELLMLQRSQSLDARDVHVPVDVQVGMSPMQLFHRLWIRAGWHAIQSAWPEAHIASRRSFFEATARAFVERLECLSPCCPYPPSPLGSFSLHMPDVHHVAQGLACLFAVYTLVSTTAEAVPILQERPERYVRDDTDNKGKSKEIPMGDQHSPHCGWRVPMPVDLYNVLLHIPQHIGGTEAGHGWQSAKDDAAFALWALHGHALPRRSIKMRGDRQIFSSEAFILKKEYRNGRSFDKLSARVQDEGDDDDDDNEPRAATLLGVVDDRTAQVSGKRGKRKSTTGRSQSSKRRKAGTSAARASNDDQTFSVTGGPELDAHQQEGKEKSFWVRAVQQPIEERSVGPISAFELIPPTSLRKKTHGLWPSNRIGDQASVERHRAEFGMVMSDRSDARQSGRTDRHLDGSNETRDAEHLSAAPATRASVSTSLFDTHQPSSERPVAHGLSRADFVRNIVRAQLGEAPLIYETMLDGLSNTARRVEDESGSQSEDRSADAERAARTAPHTYRAHKRAGPSKTHSRKSANAATSTSTSSTPTATPTSRLSLAHLPPSHHLPRHRAFRPSPREGLSTLNKLLERLKEEAEGYVRSANCALGKQGDAHVSQNAAMAGLAFGKRLGDDAVCSDALVRHADADADADANEKDSELDLDLDLGSKRFEFDADGSLKRWTTSCDSTLQGGGEEEEEKNLLRSVGEEAWVRTRNEIVGRKEKAGIRALKKGSSERRKVERGGGRTVADGGGHLEKRMECGLDLDEARALEDSARG
ncbi:hypothetical protein IE81DRAFT_350067 [Ceraceosorus guamensis]|uniref:Uncharacterized protein n=1 Tax=Ceraceosorus guamensis TaxID=1522189 RepID=A0A316VQN4_9BASI|nr:hypothetical protein IE81DRAFT_350067 [Ceraceosorus guamensis]PWN39554.1 hypothetical protein IE81DRAFT_350067 [Ceraceosorus guamensis]